MELESLYGKQGVGYVLFLFLFHITYVETLKCYSCVLVSHPSQCTNEVNCIQGEVCSVSRFSSGNAIAYNLSCASLTHCQGYFKAGIPQIGKRAGLDPERCFSCCQGENCNVNECNPHNQLSTSTWSDWSPWTQCSRSCQGGSKLRGRNCLSGEGTCPGQTYDKQGCNDHIPCQDAVGQWSPWQDWSRCPATCGTDNVQIRSRTCNDHNCQGSGQDIRFCNIKACPVVNGQWSLWSNWSVCSASCGDGKSLRSRTCSNPPPGPGGKPCEDPTSFRELRNCTLRPCAANGQWSLWSNWSVCSASCGDGKSLRSRTCSNPPPGPGGKPCEDPTSFRELRNCTLRPCAVNGQWSLWSNWSVCSASCGDGKSLRSRTCSNPPPGPGGKPCEDPTSFRELRNCTLRLCAVDGHWSEWLQWSSCSASCDDGISVRYRWCSNPPPSNGGKNCEKNETFQELRNCVVRLCAVDGQWSDWSPWTSCSATCGHGEAIRVRSCTDPAPRNGGKPCENANFNSEHKNCTSSCPVNGHWSDWSPWLQCSATCGSGTSLRVRSCSNPYPAHGGKPCDHPDVYRQNKTCNTQACPVDGHWSDWSSWLQCSVTCGAGTAIRVRTCSNPHPDNGGKPCGHPDVYKQNRPCNTQACPASTTPVVTTPTSHAVSSANVHLTTRTSITTMPTCGDSDFCHDSHIMPLACNDTYVASTYCPKMCGICGPAISSPVCADHVGSKCLDPIYKKFACADKDVAILCAKTCGLCH